MAHPTVQTMGCRHGRMLRRRLHGMALIEVLVSILLFSFGVLGLIGLEVRAIDFSVDAEDRNRAALLANEIASDMWLGGSITVVPATLTAWQTKVGTPTAGGLPNGVGTVTPVNGTTNSADIAIVWTEPSRTAGVVNNSSQLTTRVTLP